MERPRYRHRWCASCRRMEVADYSGARPVCAVCGQCQCDGCVSSLGEHVDLSEQLAQLDAIDEARNRMRRRRQGRTP